MTGAPALLLNMILRGKSACTGRNVCLAVNIKCRIFQTSGSRPADQFSKRRNRFMILCFVHASECLLTTFRPQFLAFNFALRGDISAGIRYISPGMATS
jgi:hypothetical protein